MTSVSEIFDKAERFFEVRVTQLLNEKRIKAEENGTVLNARKAKRDARTAAGREKLDALVRRLADLALIQERIIRENCPDQTLVRAALDQHTKRLWIASLGAFPPPHLMLPSHPALPPFHLHPPVFAPLPPPPLPLPVPPLRSPSPFASNFIPAAATAQFNRPLNPDADPWEAKPPSPTPTLPPPLKITSSNNDWEELDEQDSKGFDKKPSCMFASTESVLQHLGPEFDDFSPCSILDIGDPVVMAKKKPFTRE